MFDVSWGEMFVLTAVAVSMVGRKDLPKGFHFIGTQVGRVVGLMQGARARADRFAGNNELRQLQNELRSGLRELDAVKTEMLMSTAAPRQLGATVSSANRSSTMASNSNSQGNGNHLNTNIVQPSLTGGAFAATTTGNNGNTNNFGLGIRQEGSPNDSATARRELAPRHQSIAAVAEGEWEKQGIGFKSRAESQKRDNSGVVGGSVLLANLYQQTLIHDQYDRVVQEQDMALQSRVDQIQESHHQNQQQQQQKSLDKDAPQSQSMDKTNEPSTK